MALRSIFPSLLTATLVAALAAPLSAQTMVGYGLATGRAGAASGGLKKAGEGVSAGFSRVSGVASTTASSRRAVASAPAPDAMTARDKLPGPSLVRVVRSAWGEDPDGVSLPSADASMPASGRANASFEQQSEPPAPPVDPARADPASEAASRLRIGMSVPQAFDLLGTPSFSFLGVSGDGYDAKYVFQVRDKRVVALALEGVVTRILTP